MWEQDDSEKAKHISLNEIYSYSRDNKLNDLQICTLLMREYCRRRMRQFNPDWPIPPPGETISDILEERGWTREEFASKMNYQNKYIDKLIVGEVEIFVSDAVRLSEVLGSSVEFWLERERLYQECKSKDKDDGK